MALFDDLPVELLRQIAGDIKNIDDLLNFRKASAKIYFATSDIFARRVQNLRWIVAPHSLNILENMIGNNAALAGELRVLRLTSHYIPMFHYQLFNLRPGLWNMFADYSDSPECQAFVMAQGQFIHTRADLATLIRILDQLPSLEHLEVTDGQYVRDSIAKEFQIYEPSRCYGLDNAARVPGLRYDSLASPVQVYWTMGIVMGMNPGMSGLAYNFHLVLLALAATRHPIRSLRIWHWDNDNVMDHVSVEAVIVRTWHYITPDKEEILNGLAASFADLRTFSLMLRYKHDVRGEYTDQETWLADILQQAPNLRHLCLMFDNTINNTVQNHATLARYFSTFSQRVMLRNLRVLELLDATVRYIDVSNLVRRVRKTMTRFKLYNTVLVGGTWNSFFRMLHIMYTAMYNSHNPDYDASSVPEQIWLGFSWLKEVRRAGTSTINGQEPAECPNRILVFDHRGRDGCMSCHNPVWIRRRRFCIHASFACDLKRREMETGRIPTGLQVLLDAELEDF